MERAKVPRRERARAATTRTPNLSSKLLLNALPLLWRQTGRASASSARLLLGGETAHFGPLDRPACGDHTCQAGGGLPPAEQRTSPTLYPIRRDNGDHLKGWITEDHLRRLEAARRVGDITWGRHSRVPRESSKGHSGLRGPEE